MKQKLCLLLLVFATAVSAQVTNPLTGNWKASLQGYTMKLELKADGTGKLDDEPITYKVANGKITITESDNVINNYTYSLTGNKLTVSGGDLNDAITFTKESKGGLGDKVNQKTNPMVAEKKDEVQEKIPAGLKGQWSGATGTFIFNDGGKGTANGQGFNYTTNGNQVTMSDNTGTYALNYNITGNTLILTGGNGSATFTRNAGNNSSSSVPQGNGNAAQLAGKWCYLTSNYNSLYSSRNSSFTNECFTLNPNGTYTYYYESNRSANTQSGFGFSNSTDSDQGTWTYDGGNKLTVNSAKKGTVVYTIEKKNHPKNKDPMIFIDGRGYVTYYNKTPW